MRIGMGLRIMRNEVVVLLFHNGFLSNGFFFHVRGFEIYSEEKMIRRRQGENELTYGNLVDIHFSTIE